MSWQVLKFGFCASWATGSSHSQDQHLGTTVHLGPHRIGPPSARILASGPLRPSRAHMETPPSLVSKGPVPHPQEGCWHWPSQFPLEAPVVSAVTSTSCREASHGEMLIRGRRTPWLLTSISYRTIHFIVMMDLFLSTSHGHGVQRKGGHWCQKQCCASCGEKAGLRRPWSWSPPPPCFLTLSCCFTFNPVASQPARLVGWALAPSL